MIKHMRNDFTYILNYIHMYANKLRNKIKVVFVEIGHLDFFGWWGN